MPIIRWTLGVLLVFAGVASAQTAEPDRVQEMYGISFVSGGITQ